MGIKQVFAADDMVGESLVWDDRFGRLVWVDIIGRRIHALDPTTLDHRLWPLAFRPTSIGLRADGGAILGSERHICAWDWRAAPLPLIEVEPDRPNNRLNEGVVGADGAFWVGTMLNNINDDDSPRDISTATGQIYHYDFNGTLTRKCDDLFGITNTFVFPRADLLLTADTLANAIYSYEIGADGHLSHRKPVLSGFPRGLPDGSCLDDRGRVWTARVAGGGCVTCMTITGEVEAVVDLPCSWPTSCTFGGPDMSLLYVTSARFTMSADHLEANPQEGALFAVKVGVKGRPAHRFGARPLSPHGID
jgi:sugar lactone lactonase YvrE